MGILDGLGYLAGGLATGMQQGQRMHRERERERREEEEYQRAQGLRREAGNTFGSVGQQREDGSTYTAENAYEDFSNLGAKYDPQAAMQARTAGVQHKAAKVGLEGAERANRYAQNEEDVVAFLRRSQGMPDDQFYSEAAKFASRYGDDGKSFGIDFDQNGGYSAVMLHEGKVFRQPIKDRNEIAQHLMSYASPKMYGQAQELGLKGREVKAKETTAAATEGYRRDQAPVLAAQARMYDAHGRAFDAQAGYYRAGGPGGAGGLRLPEATRITLTSLQQQEKSLGDVLAKLDPSLPESRMQAAQIGQQLVRVRSRIFDTLSQAKAVPQGVTRTSFIGLEEPLDAARSIMVSHGQNELGFYQALEQFKEDYAGSPEAAEALTALEVFQQQKFYGRVHPQHGTRPVNLGLPQNMGPGNFTPVSPGGGGLPNMPQSASQYPFSFDRQRQQ